jgi:hypothetical protein
LSIGPNIAVTEGFGPHWGDIRPPRPDRSAGSFLGLAFAFGTLSQKRETLLAPRSSPIGMNINKEPNPPGDVVPEDSGPPLTDIKEPKKNQEGEGLDIDDAQIEEPKDGAFKKAPHKQ